MNTGPTPPLPSVGESLDRLPPDKRSNKDMAIAKSLLQRIGLDPSAAALFPLLGGRNNRVFRVGDDDARCLFKQYFTHPNDPRDRLGAEWAFSNLLWQNSVRCVPQAMVADDVNHAALFEWIDGQPFTLADMSDAYVDEALDFLLTVQSLRHTPAASQVKSASEACLSMDEHVTLVARRLQHLATIDTTSNAQQGVGDWIRDDLLPRWEDQLRALAVHMHASALEPAAIIPQTYRCLSPSDFGFHNVLLRDRRLVFLDFEYAGWDDPAKLVCDFFCQPQIPVPINRFDSVARPLIECLLGDEASMQTMERERLRYHLLLPVYQIKWCCILLNEFLPQGRARREHASESDITPTQMSAQFDRARQLFQMIPSTAT